MGALRRLRIAHAMPPRHELTRTPLLTTNCLHSRGLVRGWSSGVTSTVRARLWAYAVRRRVEGFVVRLEIVELLRS
jgi:hypothetical protein